MWAFKANCLFKNFKNKAAEASLFTRDFPTCVQSTDALPELTRQYRLHLNEQAEKNRIAVFA